MANDRAVATRPDYMDMELDSAGRLRLQKFEDAWRLCEWVCKAGFAPKGKTTPQQVFIAAQMGAALELDFWTSLTNVMVVNGMPTIWGDAMLAMVQNHFDTQADGMKVKSLEYFSEFILGELPNEDATAWCIAKRTGVGLDVEEIFPDRGWAGVVTVDPVVLQRAGWTVASFSVWDAKKAQLFSKAGPWSNYPRRMMAMRARSIALRNGWADVLKGFRAHEELQGTAVEAADEARQLELRGEDRVTTAADYQDAELAEQAPPEPGPAAGLKSGAELPHDATAGTPTQATGDDKGQGENVKPGASEGFDKAPEEAEDPLSPSNLAKRPPGPQNEAPAKKAYEGPDTPGANVSADDGWLHDGDIEEVAEEDIAAAEGMPVDSMGPLEEEQHGPDCQCELCLDLRRGAGSQDPHESRQPGTAEGDIAGFPTPSEQKAMTLEEIKNAYWEQIWELVGSEPQTVVKFKAYNEAMRELSGEDEITWYTRAMKHVDGHIHNVNRWHANREMTAKLRDEQTAKRHAEGPTNEHAPAEKAVAAAHSEPRGPLGDNEPDDAKPTRKAYTLEMLENEERQDEEDPDFDPLRYVNVKSKRGKGVKAYYERHLDKMVEVLSDPTVDWSEEIMGPHRRKWNSVALTAQLPFILDEKAREAQYAAFPEGHTTTQGVPSGSQADDFRMRGLKDKIRSYENHDPRLFQKVIDQLKVSKNPMTLRGAENLLNALADAWQKANS